MRIFGFSLLRNGIKYDYPFLESLTSLSLITEKITLALGNSDDGTEEVLKDLNFIDSVPTNWDESLRKGGLILSQQTNIALNALKEKHQQDASAWGIYLQCDEVLHEANTPQIIQDLHYAHQNQYDAIRFRFIHFWQDHDRIAINKKWYPSEIRAIKLNSSIESWGDAQSFRNAEKIFESDVPIYHYGHVREKNSYQVKKRDILKYYHADEFLSKYKKREKNYDNKTECINFYGIHPLVMRNRIERFGGTWMLPEVPEVAIILKKEEKYFNKNFLEKINCKRLVIEKSLAHLRNFPKDKVIFWRPNIFERFIYSNHVPASMKSKLARPWNKEFHMMLKLSEKNIGMKSPI